MSQPKKQSRKKVNSNGPALTLPSGESEAISPDQLLLDPQNLRLLERLDDSYETIEVKLFGQSAIQKKLYEVIYTDKRFEVPALANSIALSGFLKHERLIVVKYDAEKYLVLEGNRRLTAVRSLKEKFGSEYIGLPDDVRESLKTLPCFVLSGEMINGDAGILDEYRRGAEIYIGMRHLMGAKNWEPASRYEFQARLITEEKWSIDEVATRFARDKRDVVRDYQAHLLYQDFTKYEKARNHKHALTYNSFAETARAPAILKWLGWDLKDQEFKNKKNEGVFFAYLITRLAKPNADVDLESYSDVERPDISAEAAVRKLRDIVKLDDPLVEEALQDLDFSAAELLFEERKEGALSKKISTFTRLLKQTSNQDFLESPDIREKLVELRLHIDRSLKVIAALAE